ncbi:proline rich transmembrane protein 1B [Hoplias malabaricus]|uniref:proline rich transmembrane protein 1B n=1 Tax=Hoplias malabaricus TaxID=27720 RepID=UPI00346201B1
MDPVNPTNLPVGPEMHPAGLSRGQEAPQTCGHRAPPICPALLAYDSVSILTTGLAHDEDSIHTGHPVTDGDSIQTSHPANDTDSTYTAHLTYDTESNQTLNPAYDSDSTRALHPTYILDYMAAEGPAVSPGAGATSSGTATNPHDDPPPYSPPDPKLAYLIYAPPLPHYPTQQVIACQPGANPPAFYQPSFLPSSTYPSYAIYMNGSPLGEDQPPLPKDYLVESLLVTIFCCLMSGLVALMYAYETRAALARGDIQEGERASQKARLLVMFSLIFGVIVFVGWIIYVVIAICA